MKTKVVLREEPPFWFASGAAMATLHGGCAIGCAYLDAILGRDVSAGGRWILRPQAVVRLAPGLL